MMLLFFNVAVVRRMLKPLERAVAEVDALDPSDPSRRLHQPASPVEVSLLRLVFPAPASVPSLTNTQSG